MTLEKMIQLKKEKGYSTAMISKLTSIPIGTLQKIFSGETKTPRFETRQTFEEFFQKQEGQSQSADLNGAKRKVNYLDEMNEGADEVKESAAYAVEKKQGEYTIEDYYALPDDRRVELIDGVIYDMNSPRFIHQVIAGEIHLQLSNQIRDKKGSCLPVASPVDVRLDCDDKTIVQPDVIILCDKSKIESWGIMGAPEFVLEIISPSTKKKDYTIKLMKYMGAGVKEYWIIDPYKKIVIIYDAAEDGMPELRPLSGQVGLHMYDGQIQIDLDAVNEMVKGWVTEY